jgi:hypothetical protein
MNLAFKYWYRNRSLINWGKVSESNKGKSPEKDLPLLKNDITGSEPTVKMLDTAEITTITVL